MAKLPPQFQKDFSGGMATNLNPNLMPKNAVQLGLNMDFDEEIGSAVSRRGTELVGSQTEDNKDVLGLHQYVDHANSANNVLWAAVNNAGDTNSVITNVISGVDGVPGLTANTKMRFLSFLGETLAINGTDAERAYNGSAWITTGGAFDLANMPAGNLAIEFLDRVYIAGVTANPDRLHYSGVSDGSAVSWTVGNGTVDIEPEDGAGPITALGKVPGYLLVFKERSMKRWNFLNAFPESLVDIGTPSQESVITGGGVCAFYSNSSEDARGFYITNGGRPQAISHDTTRPIKKWVDAIPAANEANIAGWATDRTFNWSVGDLTVDGISYTNVVLRYNRVLNQWSVRTYPTEFKVFARYVVSGVNTIVGGDDDGNVIRVDKDSTYSDHPSATPIKFELRTDDYHFGFNQLKSVNDKAVVRGVNTTQLRTSFVVNGVYGNLITSVANFFKTVLGIFNITRPVKGTTIAVHVSGETTNKQTTIREIELSDVMVDQSYDK